MRKSEIFNFYKYIENFDDENYLYSFLKFNLAPTISKLKASTLVNLKSKNRNLKAIWDLNKKNLSKNLNIDYYILKESPDSYLILFYDRLLLKDKIFEDNCHRYLVKNGYGTCHTLDDFLNKLKYNFNNNHCPKEVGIFLDYPLEDVLDFSTCRKCKCIGYWKCYNNDNNYKNLFKLFDMAKLNIANNILNKNIKVA